MYHGKQFVLGDGSAVPIPIIKGVYGAQKRIHLPDSTGIAGICVDKKLGVIVNDGITLAVGLESAATGGSGLHLYHQIDGATVAFVSSEIQKAGVGRNPLEKGDGIIFRNPGGPLMMHRLVPRRQGRPCCRKTACCPYKQVSVSKG